MSIGKVKSERVQEEYGSWRSWSLTPGPELFGLVHDFWGYEGEFSYGSQRIFPNTDCALIINFASPHRLIAGPESARGKLFSRNWVSGVQSQYLEATPTGEDALLGMRFNPLALKAILGVGAKTVSSQVIELENLLSDEQMDPWRDIQTFSNWDQRLIAVNALVAGRMSEIPSARDSSSDWARVYRADQQLRQLSGKIRISELAEAAGWSPQTFGRRYREWTGHLPKMAARLLRFEALTRRWGEQPESPLTDIALEFGYFDQPHLNRDFKQFTGLTPTQYLARYIAADDGLYAVGDSP